MKVVLDRAAAGRIQIPGIHPETVSATRRLISVVIWLFALSAAYPFLPGANSLAFKGISVFFGLMLTLGSTGVMTHAMSGPVLIYFGRCAKATGSASPIMRIRSARLAYWRPKFSPAKITSLPSRTRWW